MDPQRSFDIPHAASRPLLCAASNAGTAPSTRTSSACASASCAHVIASPSSALSATSSSAPPCRASALASAPTPPTFFTRVRCATPCDASAQRTSQAHSAILASPLSHRRVAKSIASSFFMSSDTPCSDAARMRMHSSAFKVSEPMPLTPPRLVVPEVPSAAAGVSSPSPSSSSATAMATSLPTTPLWTMCLSAPGTHASSAAIAALALSFVARPNPFPVRSTSSITLRHAPRKSLGTGTLVARVANAAQHCAAVDASSLSTSSMNLSTGMGKGGRSWSPMLAAGVHRPVAFRFLSDLVSIAHPQVSSTFEVTPDLRPRGVHQDSGG